MAFCAKQYLRTAADFLCNWKNNVCMLCLNNAEARLSLTLVYLISPAFTWCIKKKILLSSHDKNPIYCFTRNDSSSSTHTWLRNRQIVWCDTKPCRWLFPGASFNNSFPSVILPSESKTNLLHSQPVAIFTTEGLWTSEEMIEYAFQQATKPWRGFQWTDRTAPLIGAAQQKGIPPNTDSHVLVSTSTNRLISEHTFT